MTFFEVNLDYVYMLSGLAFASLGAVAAGLMLERDRALPWWEFAAFGMAQGLATWGTMVAHSLGDTVAFAWARTGVRAFAFVALLEFGRRGLRGLGFRLPRYWITILLLAGVALSVLGGHTAAEAAVHYLLAAPAAILGTSALVVAGLRRRRRRAWTLVVAGAALGLFTGTAAVSGVSETGLGCGSGAFVGGIPLQMFFGALALVAGSCLLGYSSLRQYEEGAAGSMPVALGRFGIVALLAIVLTAGGLAVTVASDQSDAANRTALRERALSAAAALSAADVAQLTGHPEDKTLPAYQRVRDSVESVHRASHDVGFMYLMRTIDGEPTFLLDSRVAAAGDVSQPGDIYHEASPLMLRVLAGAAGPTVEGPETDRWGTWVTAFAPVRDRAGSLVGVLGMDVAYADWAAGSAHYRMTAISIVLVAVILTLTFFANLQVSRDASARLASSENRLRTIFDSVTDGIVLLEPETRLARYANPQMGRMLDREIADIVGITVDTFMAPDSRWDCGVPAQDGPTRTETRLATAESTEIDAEITCTSVEIEGEPLVLAYFHDITERKRAERELRERIALENIVRGVSSRFVASDASEVHRTIDDALGAIGAFLGVSRTHITRVTVTGTGTRTHEWCADGVEPMMPFQQNVPLSEYRWFLGRLQTEGYIDIPDVSALPDEAAPDREMMLAQGVGSRVVVPIVESGRLSGYLCFDSTHVGTPWSAERIALLAVTADVFATALRRARAETELARLSLAVTQSPAGTVITDAEGLIEYVNPRFRELCGYELPELIGQSTRILKSGRMPEDVYAEMWRAITAGQQWRGEIVNKRKDGSLYWVQASISPIHDPDGVIHYVSVQEDITVAKIAEDALRTAREAAEDANRAKSEFLSTMSHEIRTPMNAIIGMAELLDETDLSEEQRRYVQIFRSAGESLLTLVNDILDLSKIEAGKVELDVRPFGLERLVEQTADVLAIGAREKGIDLLVEVSPDLPENVTGDPDRLRQVLVNLLGNAIKFTERGHVLLSVSCNGADEGGRIRFAVSDTGIGMPANKLEAIFDAFTQADSSTTRRFGGTGLGLTISRRLVDLMGGRLIAASAQGDGSTFSFALPLREAEGEPSTEPAPKLSGVKALVVDDEAANRLIIRHYLEYAGAKVVEAASAPEALGKLGRQRTPFDIVLTDLRMPDVSGSDLLEAMRADERFAAIPVLVVSSDAHAPEADSARARGAADTLIKPVRRRDLLGAVDFIMNRTSLTEQPSVGSFSPSVNDAVPLVDTHTIGQRVLLVEDTEDSRLLVQAYLKNTPHRATAVENGKQAVEAYEAAGANGYDVILMDMQMPVMDGYAATRAIREIERTRHFPRTRIIALTAYALAQETKTALAAGCDEYLTKPLKKATLLEALDRTMEV